MMKSNRWVIYTIMFVVITILLFFVIMWNPMWGCFAFLLLLLAFFVGNIVKTFLLIFKLLITILT